MICYRSASVRQVSHRLTRATAIVGGYLPPCKGVCLTTIIACRSLEVDQILAWVDILLQRDSDSSASARPGDKQQAEDRVGDCA